MSEDLSDIIAGEVQLLATGFQFTEGPLWHPHGYWHFVDTRPNLVFEMPPGGQPEVFRADSGRTNGLTFDLQGRLLMCEGYGRRVSRMESDGSVATLVGTFGGKRLNRPNDIVCHSSGAIYFTDPQGLVAEEDRELGSSAVFCVSPDGHVAPVVLDVTYPNGLAFSPDERTFYLVDFPNMILAYDMDAQGSLSNKRLFIDMTDAPGDGHPDGETDHRRQAPDHGRVPDRDQQVRLGEGRDPMIEAPNPGVHQPVVGGVEAVDSDQKDGPN